MLKPLRLALLYGHLLARGSKLYHPGSAHPVCSVALAEQMIRAGLLVRNGQFLELTAEGRSFAA